MISNNGVVDVADMRQFFHHLVSGAFQDKSQEVKDIYMPLLLEDCLALNVEPNIWETVHEKGFDNIVMVSLSRSFFKGPFTYDISKVFRIFTPSSHHYQIQAISLPLVRIWPTPRYPPPTNDIICKWTLGRTLRITMFQVLSNIHQLEEKQRSREWFSSLHSSSSVELGSNLSVPAVVASVRCIRCKSIEHSTAKCHLYQGKIPSGTCRICNRGLHFTNMCKG